MLALLVVVAFAVVLRAVDELRAAGIAARHSQQVLAVANELERLVIDLETGQRGFMITGDERFLRPWDDARRKIPDVAVTLQRLAAARSVEQGGRAGEIGGAVDTYIRDYSVPAVEAARRDRAAVQTVALTEDGRQRVDDLRARFDRFAQAEYALADARDRRTRVAARRVVVAAVAGVGGSIFLVALFTVYLTRTIVRPMGAALETSDRELRRLVDELAESRARVIVAADEARRRLERDLHDGIQQRLVSLALDLRTATASVPPELVALQAQLAQTADGLGSTLDELREFARGIHPSILARGGLEPALRTLARRSPVPVLLQCRLDGRLSDSIEVAMYYVVSEALTNVAKHADASRVCVDLEAGGAWARLKVDDDGAGGAAPSRGSGLIGLRDRIEALGGTMQIASPPGKGTTLLVEMPVAT